MILLPNPRDELADADTARAIEQLVIEHAYYLDHGLAALVPTLYTQSGRLVGLADVGIGSNDLSGPALHTWAQERASRTDLETRHVCTNIRVVVAGVGRVRSRCCVTVYRVLREGVSHSDAAVVPQLVGEYADTCVLTDSGRWLFEERQVLPTFLGQALRSAVKSMAAAP